VKKTLLLLFVCCVSFGGSLQAQNQFQCRNGEDMLNYFVMGYPARIDSSMGSTNANPIYSSITPELGAGYARQGYFVWTKSPLGYPWDVKTFDRDYIYDHSTELVWTNPTSFKRFDQDLPLSPRCVSTRNGGGDNTIQTRQRDTSYEFYNNCTSYQTADLGYVTTSISRPTIVNAGGNLGPVKTRILTYTYACNSRYSQCGYMEVFSLGWNVGLYDWKYYTAQNGRWVLVQDSIINNFTLGQSVPMFSCSDTYQ